MTLKVGKGIEIISLSPSRARVNLRVPFGESLSLREPSAEVLSAMASFAAPRSLQMGGGEGVNPGLQQADVFPNEQTDYIYPKFRVLSATLIPGYFIDFSKENVLKDSMALLAEQTVYCDHVYWRTREWVGVVNSVLWDDKADSVGAPGINSEMKVDWRKAPDIARGLLMKPPAVRAVSATVDFDWDASHPDLLEKRIFWQSLGEEVDGEIVRLIVNKITDYYEVSFVYKGANPGSNGLLPEDEDETEMSAPPKGRGQGSGVRGQLSPVPGARNPKPTTKETKKVKLTTEQKTKFAITAEGEEVEDAIVLRAAESLAARATAADAIVSAQRAEVLRLATIAEGEGEGDARKLDPTIASLIDKADASQLPSLTTMYQKKVDELLPLSCEHGHKATSRRSSVENPQTVQNEVAPAGDSYPGM